jgi:hypothetical protein
MLSQHHEIKNASLAGRLYPIKVAFVNIAGGGTAPIIAAESGSTYRLMWLRASTSGASNSLQLKTGTTALWKPMTFGLGFPLYVPVFPKFVQCVESDALVGTVSGIAIISVVVGYINV